MSLRMSHTLENLQQRLESRFGEAILAAVIALDELTITVCPKAWRVVASALRDEFGFEQLVDLCGMDYSAYADRVWEKPRYAAVTHLLSVQHNVRLRVKVFAADDDFPLIDSVNEVWSSANWYEREAFDLYGIVFVDQMGYSICSHYLLLYFSIRI
jgi:NADH-quinone oxidoreductase subunit C